MASELIQRQKNDFFRDITSLGSLLFYVIIVLASLILEKYEIFIKLIIGAVLIQVATVVTKLVYFKNRPLKYNYSNYIERLDASSFPSVHSARITFLGALFMKYLSNISFSILLVAIALIVLYSRIYLKKHDVKDVIGGVALGILIFYAVIILLN